MNCDEARQATAVALLTRHPPTSDAAEHIDGCPDCRSVQERLTPLPDLLALAHDPALRHPEPAGDVLLARLLATARRRRRTRVWVAAAVAVALVLAIPLVIATLLGNSSPPASAPAATQSGTVVPSPAATFAAEDQATGVSGQVEVRATAWGSDLTFEISGVQPGTLCGLTVITRDGRSHSVGSWRATGEHYTQVHGSVAAPPSQIQQVDIVDGDSGDLLLQIGV
jgi:hypothetical protein